MKTKSSKLFHSDFVKYTNSYYILIQFGLYQNYIFDKVMCYKHKQRNRCLLEYV